MHQRSKHNELMRGQTGDWLRLPDMVLNQAQANVRIVTVDKESGSQSAGDPVGPTGGDRYFSGTLNVAGDIWIYSNDHKRLGRNWLAAEAKYKGLLDGTHDPDPEGTSDERPVYKIDPESDGETIAVVTTEASAASSAASPSTDGRCTTYKIDGTGNSVIDDTDVAFSNFSNQPLEVNAVIALEEFQGQRFGIELARSPTAKIGQTNETITARSGAQMGSGGVSVQNINATGLLSDSTNDETWYNLAEETIVSGVYVMAKPFRTSAGTFIYVIDFEECSE